MPRLINPRYQLKIFGDETFTFEDYYHEHDVEKDLEEEPNRAQVIISNLKDATRGKLVDAANQSAPVELYLTPSGVNDLVLAFKGEFDTSESIFGRPGYESVLSLLSQQNNHRARYIDTKTFAKGTPINDVVSFLIDQTGLPRGRVDELPYQGILFSESLSGPAYPLLRKYAFDLGRYAYILDGTINVTSIHIPQVPNVKQINPGYLLDKPAPTKRNDRRQIEMDTKAVLFNKDIFTKVKRKRKKSLTDTKVPGRTDYVEYQAVDVEVEGISLPCFCIPDLQPDDIINVPTEELGSRLWRVQTVRHYGNSETFSDWSTHVEADAYDDSGGDLEAELLDIVGPAANFIMEYD
jgi:hypothetical protein